MARPCPLFVPGPQAFGEAGNNRIADLESGDHGDPMPSATAVEPVEKDPLQLRAEVPSKGSGVRLKRRPV